MLSKFIQKVISIFKRSKKRPQDATSVKIPYAIDRSFFSPAAIKVIERLKQNGFEAYFVGGCIRDILLGHRPKDFDVVTNARPEQIIRIFSNAIIIGRRFTLVHVRFRQEIVEVATFRRDHRQNDHAPNNGIIFDDNCYGTLEDDVIRRDFTLNALYYDPIQKVIIDYVGGIKDAKAKQLKTIGEDLVRFTEDPVRMIRAMRYAAKLNLKLTDQTKNAILTKGSLILHVPKARLYEEFLKCFSQPCASTILTMMNVLKFSRYLVPKWLLVSNKDRKVISLLQWMNKQAMIKEHHAVIITLCFIAPSLKDLPEKKLSETLVKALGDFQKLIALPKQVEYALRSYILHEKIPENIRARIKPIPEWKTLKTLVQELLAK